MLSFMVYLRVCGDVFKLLWDSLVNLALTTFMVCELIGRAQTCTLHLTCLELYDTERHLLLALATGSVGSALTLARRCLELGTSGIVYELLWRGTDIKPLDKHVGHVRRLGSGSGEACNYVLREVNEGKLTLRADVGIKYVSEHVYKGLKVMSSEVVNLLSNSFKTLTRGIYSFFSEFTHGRKPTFFSAWLKPPIVKDDPRLCDSYIVTGLSVASLLALMNLMYLNYVSKYLRDHINREGICYIVNNILAVKDKIKKIHELSGKHESEVNTVLTLLDGFTLLCT